MIQKLFCCFLITTSIFCQPGFTDHYVKSSDDTEIHYVVAGESNIALVFVHGWSCDAGVWNNQLPLFSNNYKVIALDLAGHGASGSQRENYTIQAFASDVKSVVDDQQTEKVVLIGHSMGGAVIIEAARLMPGKVIGLIGADTFQDFTDRFTKQQAETFVEPFKNNFEKTCREFVGRLFPESADSILVLGIKNKMCSADKAIAVSSMLNLFEYDPVPTLKEINLPMITINSTFIPTNTEANASIVKTFSIKFMDGVGHFVMLEDPMTFNSLLSETIDQLIH